jgi:hypothetical protein
MKEIMIQIERSDLADMGIKQQPEYIPLKFRESALNAYFIGEDALTVYIGADSFLCQKTKKNIELFDSLL